MMSLAEAAAAMQGRKLGAHVNFTGVNFAGVSTDSRSIGRGELFVAIRGERFDGHKFIDVARQRGAAAAVVDGRFAEAPPLPAIVVDDTRKALGRLGRSWRSRFSPVLVCIAGANGKTTTKEMLASILRAHAGTGAVLATRGNLNTDIGVPMTLLGMTARHRFCAIEVGMNHPGEIEWLADLAQPTVALVTNAQREHMEFMKSVEASAEENANVYRALPPDGVAVVNADDPCHSIFRRAAGSRPIVEFSLAQCAFSLRPLESEIAIGEVKVTLAIPGLQNVRNALAAAACAQAAGVPLPAIARGLGDFRPYAGRLQVKRTAAGATLIDDSYNANPDSVRASIDVLAACPGPTALVLGDMGEVGEQGPEFHREVGRYAKEKGVGAVLTFGNASRESSAAFGGSHFEQLERLVEKAKEAKTILVKGSRFMQMERAVALLTGEKAGGH